MHGENKTVILFMVAVFAVLKDTSCFAISWMKMVGIVNLKERYGSSVVEAFAHHIEDPGSFPNKCEAYAWFIRRDMAGIMFDTTENNTHSERSSHLSIV